MNPLAHVREPCPPGATHCVTCSDEAVPMRVVALMDGVEGAAAVALCEDESGRRRDVLVGLVDHARPGDRLLVHAGAALRRLGEGSAS